MNGYDNVGLLFGYVSAEGEASNITMDNISVEGSVTGNSLVGGLAGYTYVDTGKTLTFSSVTTDVTVPPLKFEVHH